jgi:hypothetical protein
MAGIKKSNDLEILHAFYHTFVANRKGILITNIGDKANWLSYYWHGLSRGYTGVRVLRIG